MVGTIWLLTSCKCCRDIMIYSWREYAHQICFLFVLRKWNKGIMFLKIIQFIDSSIFSTIVSITVNIHYLFNSYVMTYIISWHRSAMIWHDMENFFNYRGNTTFGYTYNMDLNNLTPCMLHYFMHQKITYPNSQTMYECSTHVSGW